jgi:hypothetical protein
MNDFDAIKQVLANSGVYYLVLVDMNSTYAKLHNKYLQAFKDIHGDLIGRHYSKTMHSEDTDNSNQVSQGCFLQADQMLAVTT